MNDNGAGAERILWKLLIAFLLGYFVLYLGYAYKAVNLKVILDGYEGTVLAFTRWVAQGHSLYGKSVAMDYPFAHPVYTPVFFYVTALPLKVFGGAFWAGRAVSLAATLASAGLLYATAARRGAGARAAGVCALLFLSFSPVMLWSVLNRVDNLALMFLLAGVYVYYRFEEHAWMWLMCAPLFCLGVCTKQSMIAVPAGLCAALLFSKWKRAFLVGLLSAGLAAAVFLLLNAATDGGFFMHVAKVSKNRIILSMAYERTKLFLSSPLPAVCAGFALWLAVSGRMNSFECWYVAAAGALSLATIGYLGGNLNYFIELCCALSLAVARGLSEMEKKPGGAGAALAALLAAVAVGTVFQLSTIASFYRGDPHGSGYSVNVPAAMDEISRRYSSGDELLFEDVQVPLLLGWDLKFFSTNEYNILMDSGFYNDDELLRSIKTKRWKAIVLNDTSEDPAGRNTVWFSKAQLEAIVKNYRRDRTFERGQRQFSLYVRE